MVKLELTELEIEMIKFILEYFYDADLSNFKKKEILATESIMRKIGIEVKDSKSGDGIEESEG